MHFSIDPTTGVTSFYFDTKEAFLKVISEMVDAHIASKGTVFNIEVSSNAPVRFYNKETDDWEYTPWGEKVM